MEPDADWIYKINLIDDTHWKTSNDDLMIL